MPTINNNVLMKYKDSSGNVNLLYPITLKDNVDGIDEAIRNQAVVAEGTGSVYTATVEGIASLSAGVSFVMIPHVESTTSSPKLNVNSLGEKLIRRRISNCTGAFYNASAQSDWLTAGKPITMTYDGEYWIADLPAPNANDIVGTVSIESGGTGATTVAGARNALGLGNTSGALPIENGGTGATTVEAARNVLGLGNTSGALPIANGGTGATNASDARSNLGAASRVSYTAAITIDWTGSSAPYMQVVSVSGILATDCPHITPVYSSTLETALLEKEAWSMVSKAETSDGSIMFTCFEDKPSTEISIQIEVIR